ncbi:pleiotropic regulatory protein RsmS [Rahnella sp. ChDrAdgB13]|uniref:pleiotropic regulatory protein RsmS n=1 Tax=Rahnella sp. ChDrAdgB13 TaxID=1850581 RepID=UPI001AD88000|nr:pleiotropic regulatory protein RsmS [Rahnella sp. ChDrAdgB13]
MSVENAPPELLLAVDLIYLLECNEIAPETALAALEIVQRDYQEKLKNSKNTLSISYL